MLRLAYLIPFSSPDSRVQHACARPTAIAPWHTTFRHSLKETHGPLTIGIADARNRLGRELHIDFKPECRGLDLAGQGAQLRAYLAALSGILPGPKRTTPSAPGCCWCNNSPKGFRRTSKRAIWRLATLSLSRSEARQGCCVPICSVARRTKVAALTR